MFGKHIWCIAFSRLLLACLIVSYRFRGTKADENFTDANVEESFVGLHVSFAEWCSTSFCNLRLFTLVGGELLMIDSGSSSLAFCDPPNTDFVTDQQRVFVYDNLGNVHDVSQCTKYGSGGHGWFGETYSGTIETAGVKNPGQVYTIMNVTVGLDGNQCGPIMEGSIGIEPNTTIRGIMGTGSNDRYTFTDFINASTWTDLAVQSGQCIYGECRCPPPVVTGMDSTFLSALASNDIYQFAITWNGTLGKNTGAMLWNEYADLNIPVENPKVPIEIDPQRSLNLWATNVTGFALDGVMTNVTTRMYYLDTGAGYISLPDYIYDNIQDGTVVTFYYPTMDWEYGNITSLNITVTQELVDARIFRRASPSGFHLMGANVFRYLDKLLISFNGTKPYFRATTRETPILDLPINLPVGELAASESDDIQELNVTNATTGDINCDCNNVVSETIMDIAGVIPPTATPISASSGGATYTRIVLAVAAVVPLATFV